MSICNKISQDLGVTLVHSIISYRTIRRTRRKGDMEKEQDWKGSNDKEVLLEKVS